MSLCFSVPFSCLNTCTANLLVALCLICTNVIAAGLAVSMVINLQIYCTGSEFFQPIKHVFKGSLRLRQETATYSPILLNLF